MGTKDDNLRNGASGPLILVADGSAENRAMTSDQLAAGGMRALCAESGGAALMILRSERPALVLADQNVPGLSGIELVREMQARQDDAQIPVIITTRHGHPSLAVAALDAGADDHIVLPCPGEVLIARIARQLDRARRNAELHQAVHALDTRLVRRTLEVDELAMQIEALNIEKAALGARLASRDQAAASGRAKAPVKSIAAI